MQRKVVVCAIVLVLLGLAHAAFVIECESGEVSLNLTETEATDFGGFRVGLVTDNPTLQCIQPIMDGTAVLDCTGYVLDTPFELAVFESVQDMVILESTTVVLNVTCLSTSQFAVVFSNTLTVTLPTPSVDVTDDLEPLITIVAPETVVAVGESLTLQFTSSKPEYATYVVGLYELQIDFDGDSIPDAAVISAGCEPDTISLVEMLVSGQSSTATITFKAFLLYSSSLPLSSSSSFFIHATFDMCPFAYDCMYSCAVRKRRNEAAEKITSSIISQEFRVFLSKEAKEEFLANAQNQGTATETAATPKTESEDNVLVNKAVLGLTLGLLLTGLCVSFLATVFMLTKIRKSQRTKIRRRHTSYPNRGYMFS